MRYQYNNFSEISTESPLIRIPVAQANSVEKTATPEKVYVKKKVGEDQQHVVRLASQISSNDLDWILTLEAENGLWDMYRKHPIKNKNGTWDYSCGLNSAYHKEEIEKIKARTVSEEEILRYCYSVYKERPTAFYGYKVRFKNLNKFQLI